MRKVEGDQVGERPHRHFGGVGRGEIRRHVRLELGRQDGVLELTHFGIAVVRRLGDFDQHGAGCAQLDQCRCERRVGVRMEAGGVAQHADADPAQGVRLQSGRKAVRHAVGAGRRGVGWIAPRHRVEQQRRVGYAPRHRPGSILGVTDRHDVGARDHADRRLQADQPIDRRRTCHRAVGFCADGRGSETGRRCCARARARAAGVSVKGIRVTRLPADCAPAADRSRRADVGPFRQIGLAEDDRPRRPQPGNQRRIAAAGVVRECEAAGGCRDRISAFDIVLDQDRHAGERTLRLARLARGISGCRLRRGARVEGDNRVQHRVERGDPRSVKPNQLGRCDAAGSKVGLDLHYRLFDHIISSGWRGSGGEQHPADGERNFVHRVSRLTWR